MINHNALPQRVPTVYIFVKRLTMKQKKRQQKSTGSSCSSEIEQKVTFTRIYTEEQLQTRKLQKGKKSHFNAK